MTHDAWTMGGSSLRLTRFKEKRDSDHITAVRLGCLLSLLAFSDVVWSQCTPAEQLNLVAGDAMPNDRFGTAVAIDGDTLVIGSRFDSHVGSGNGGSAYVFVRSDGGWTLQAKLTVAGISTGAQLGNAVSISGDTAVIGALADDQAGGEDAGAAYVFVRTGTTWTQQAMLVANGDVGSDLFGASVAVSGDSAFIGAPYDDSGGPDAGAAYVFVRSGTSWSLQTKLLPPSANDLFGYSVAMSGATAVVGSGLYLSPISIRVFVKSGDAWNLEGSLSMFSSTAPVGQAVAISGDTCLISSHFDDLPGATNSGSVRVFHRSNSVWTFQAKLVAGDPAANDEFGYSVAISGDTAVIGAHFDDNSGGTNTGAAYVFTRTGTTWTQQAKLMASNTASNDEYGSSVAVQGDDAFVGVRFDDHAAGSNAGSVWVFNLGCDDDQDGVLDTNDVCPTNSPELPIDCTGRPLRDANNDCLVDTDDIPPIADELLSISGPLLGCNGMPLRDANGDTHVDGADIQQIVNELLLP